MIHTIRAVAVGDQESKIDSPIILYRGDREVEVEFTINGSKFTFTNGGNVIKSTNATHGQLVINTPTGENMFSEVTECHDGKVVFVITKEMIDELIEVGFYSFQIRLFDESQVSRVTIPPVLKGIDIRNPIAAEDETNVVDIGLVDYAVVVKDEFEDLSTFLPDGNYNKTEWESKDVISGAKLNKIEDALYDINSNMETSDLALLNKVENINKTIHDEIDKLGYELESEVEQFKIDANAAMTAYKNEVSEELAQITTSVNYEMFGAKGDGVINDYNAIYATHEYANTHNISVEGKGGSVYYLKDIPRPILIKTHTNWNGATFLIDDTEPTYNRQDVFKVPRELDPLNITIEEPILKGTKTIPSLANYTQGESIVYIENSLKRMFIRKGNNQDTGQPACDIFRLTKNGEVLDDILYDFDTITSAYIYHIEPTVLRIGGGNFVNICNQEQSDYRYYRRGIYIERSNVTMSNINHFMQSEPLGDRTSSPYEGFITTNKCCNFSLRDSNLVSHKTYLTSGGTIMGSYDMRFELSINVLLDNVNQTNDITKSNTLSYPIHTSNGCKEMIVKHCTLNRIDAHRGIYNLTVEDCEIGYNGIVVIGMGSINLNRTHFIKSNSIVVLRHDYGSSFDGDVQITNCRWTLPSDLKTTINIVQATNDGTWDFGYECRFPNISINNLLVDDSHYIDSPSGIWTGISIFDNKSDCTEEGSHNPLYMDYIKATNCETVSETGGFYAFHKAPEYQYKDKYCKPFEEGYRTNLIVNNQYPPLEIKTNMDIIFTNVDIHRTNKPITSTNTVLYNNFYAKYWYNAPFSEMLSHYQKKDVKGNYKVLPKFVLNNCKHIMSLIGGIPLLGIFNDCQILSSQQGYQGSHSYYIFNNCNFDSEKWFNYLETVLTFDLTLEYIEQTSTFDNAPGCNEFHNCSFLDLGEYKTRFDVTDDTYNSVFKPQGFLYTNGNKSNFRNLRIMKGCTYPSEYTFSSITGGDLRKFLDKYDLESLYNQQKIVHYANTGDSSSRPSSVKINELTTITPKVGQYYFDTTLNKPIVWNGTGWVDLSGNNV